MNCRAVLTMSAVVFLMAAWTISDGAIPTLDRLKLAIAGFMFLILSSISKAK